MKLRPFVGGQAIIEGVMMKGPQRIALASRRPDGSIATKVIKYQTATKRFPLGFPFIRGIVFLVEMLIVGIKALLWSANEQTEEKEELGAGELGLTLLISLVLAVGLFVAVPYVAAWLTVGTPTSLMFNLVDGVVRLVIFLAYIYLIGLSSDVRRLYQYHGAEHAAVNCFEAGKELSVTNARKFSSIHVRCGTSLLIYVIAISIVLFSLIRTPVWYYNIPIRLLLVPLIGGIGYELLRLSARHHSIVLSILTLPGRWTQQITTRRPDAKQLEVAIAALKRAL